jgi:hypothetical protein
MSDNDLLKDLYVPPGGYVSVVDAPRRVETFIFENGDETVFLLEVTLGTKLSDLEEDDLSEGMKAGVHALIKCIEKDRREGRWWLNDPEETANPVAPELAA